MPLRKRQSRFCIVCFASFLLIPFNSGTAQCSALTGFPKLACEAATRTRGAKPQPPAVLSPDKRFSLPLSTSLGDISLSGALPPSESPKSFKSLFLLSRSDDGAFVLRPGFYAARVESFYFENTNNATARVGAYFPAPLKGSRASIICAVLKQAELHPEIRQGAIQDLLSDILRGMNLEAMPMVVQQTALIVLPKDAAKQLQESAHTKATARNVMDFLNKQVLNGPKHAQPSAQDARQPSQPPAGDDAEPLQDDAPLPAVRGTWAQMPGGFYVRYLPEDCWHTRIEVMVPDAALKDGEPQNLLTFDPTQYLAVLAQDPGQRLGITLRH